MSRTLVRPYLIAKDDKGAFRITLRETRYNSQNYPLVTTTLLEDSFRTATAARAYALEQYGADASQVATK